VAVKLFLGSAVTYLQSTFCRWYYCYGI